MQKPIKYAIFKTKWGYFGLAGTEYALCRTCLPRAEADKVKIRLVGNLPGIKCDRAYFDALQKQIAAYFEGVCVNFGPDIPVMLDGFSTFCTSVLTACRYVNFGQTITYAGLAKRLGRPKAARAVGNALAKNPLPLIIPCHRVIRNDGSLGGFSAPGGLSLKRKLLLHEQSRQTTMVSGEPRTRPASFLLNETVGSNKVSFERTLI
jgi:methylated-DNA-[protein]-cysteine S-methyltransferase